MKDDEAREAILELCTMVESLAHGTVHLIGAGIATALMRKADDVRAMVSVEQEDGDQVRVRSA